MPHLLPEMSAHRHRSPKRSGRTSLLLGLAAIVSLVGLTTWLVRRQFQNAQAPPDVMTHTVAAGPFLHEVIERGEIESSRNVEIRCLVKSRNGAGTAIIDVVPEGTQVKEGDVLARLDSSALETERVQQQILCNTSQALMIQAQNTFEAAEIAVKEYLEGTYLQEEQVIKNEIVLAEENLRRSTQYSKYSEQLAARGYVTTLQLEGDRFAVEKAQGELETAQTKLRVLREYTRTKMLKQLESAVRTAEAQWESAKSSYELELSKLKEVEQQIASCTILAPQSGQVVYANEQSSRSSGEFVVEPGAIVRERQVIFRLPDPNFMQVDAKINESRVTLIRAEMPVKIRLDAFPELDLQGTVTKVNEYPEASSWFSSQVKKYAATIAIDNPPKDLRAGLTAEVRVQVDFEQNVVQVPVQAIHEHDKKLYCLVQHQGKWSAPEIKIQASNDKFAVVTQGIVAGDIVAMDPRPLLAFVDLPVVTSDREKPAPVVANTSQPASPAAVTSAAAANPAAPVDSTSAAAQGSESSRVAAEEGKAAPSPSSDEATPRVATRDTPKQPTSGTASSDGATREKSDAGEPPKPMTQTIGGGGA